MSALKDAYSSRDLTRILGISQQGIDKRAKRENWIPRPRAGRGGGSEWIFASMPEATQQTIRAKLVEHLFTDLPKEGQARKHAESVARQKGLRDLMVLSRAGRRRAEARAALVGTFEAWRIVAGVGVFEARAAFAVKYSLGEIEVEAWVREAVPRFHFNSLGNWQKTLREKGIAALGGQTGAHLKGKGVIDQNPAMREYIIGMVAKFYGVTCIDILESLGTEFAGQRLPTLRDLQRWVKKYKKENEAGLLYHQNPDAYRNTHMPAFGDASEGIERPNQLWELDSSPTDILLADGKRYTLLACIDVATRRAIFHLAKTSSSAGVCALLRKALLFFGVPEEIKTDNGSDYKSVQVTSAIHALGITQTFCTPFSPQQKPHVERLFRTFQGGIVKLCKGYIGNSVAVRKAIESQKSFAERVGKKQGEKREMEVFLSPDEFQERCNTWSADWYGERKHSKLRVSPNEAAARSKDPVVRVADERALDVLLLPVASKGGIRAVGKNGVKTDSGTFYAPLLGGYVGEEVQVFHDEDNAGYVYVFTLDGEFLCRAEDPRRTGVSRRELGLGAKHAERSVRKAGEKEIRNAIRRIDKNDIAAELLAAKAEAAAEARAARPAPADVNTYTTPALEEAGRAARVDDMPAERVFTEAERKREQEILQIRADYEKEHKYLPAESFAKHLIFEERLAKGEALDTSEAYWHAVFKLSSAHRYYSRVLRVQNGRMPADVLSYYKIFQEIGTKKIMNE